MPTLRLTSWTLAAILALAILGFAPGAPAGPSGPANASAAGPVERAVGSLQKRRQLSKRRARWTLAVYKNARRVSARLNKPIRGKSDRARAKRDVIKLRRGPMRWQLRNIQQLAREGKINRYRIAPLFTTLNNNARWFRHNGPVAAGTDRRFGDSRIIFQYFAGIGWQFHPLSNFSKLNGVWTVDTPPSRRAQRSYARELIRWGVRRGSALTWEYYFDFAGSSAPWVSAISQGTAMQALARVGYRMHNRSMMRAARLAGRSFLQGPPRGVQLRRDGGYHFLGYSGNSQLIILNMFLQSLNGMRTYYVLADDKKMRRVYRKGVAAAIVETPQFDTGSWSLYSLGGEKTDLHYHLLTIQFLNTLCKNTKEPVFCTTRDKFRSYAR